MTTSTVERGSMMVEKTAEFVLAQLARHREAWNQATACPPLVVGVQGPQGAGKSYLTGLLPAHLAQQHSLRLAIMSLDDFYLPHNELLKLHETNPQNPLLNGRGPAGTHDLPLLKGCLTQLAKINDAKSEIVRLPTYDKSLFGGEGDRTSETVQVTGPVDVVIFEGWMNGFSSLSDEELRRRYDEAETQYTGGNKLAMLSYPKEVLLQINSNLRQYEDQLWGFIHCFVQIEPVDLSYVWTWRLQQEHHMKSLNGGNGMTDEQVRAFINRYMPSYELFQEGINRNDATWHGRGLRFVVDISRSIVDIRAF